MATPIVAHLQRLLLVSSVSRFDELEKLVQHVEQDACALAGMPRPAAQGNVLTRLRRADKSLGACVSAPAADMGSPGEGTPGRALSDPLSGAARSATAPGRGAAAPARPVTGGTGQRPAEVDRDRSAAPAGPTRASLDLIALRDEALLASHSEYTTAQQVSERVFQQIGEILQAEGITPLAASGTVDPKRHHVIGVRETEDRTLDGRIAEAVRPGYAFNGRVIRPGQVIIWRAVRAVASADG